MGWVCLALVRVSILANDALLKKFSEIRFGYEYPDPFITHFVNRLLLIQARTMRPKSSGKGLINSPPTQ